jgi:hypothetical protein
VAFLLPNLNGLDPSVEGRLSDYMKKLDRRPTSEEVEIIAKVYSEQI